MCFQLSMPNKDYIIIMDIREQWIKLLFVMYM